MVKENKNEQKWTSVRVVILKEHYNILKERSEKTGKSVPELCKTAIEKEFNIGFYAQ